MLSMRMKRIKYINIVYFLFGALACYLTLQISLLDIKTEVDIPDLLVNLIGISVGLYIAHTIQKNFTQSQNKHSYLISKLDPIWESYFSFSQAIHFQTQIEASTIKSLSTKVIFPLNFFKNLYLKCNLTSNHINQLERELEQLDRLLSSGSVSQNIVDISAIKVNIETLNNNIESSFLTLLHEVQEM